MIDRNAKILKLKLDVVFKRVFGNANNEDIITAFISDLLEIPRDSINKVYISNIEMAPESLEQKFSRLDLRLDVDDRIVNVEMQVNQEPDFRERTLFYWAKLYSDMLKSGGEYGELRQTICINIVNFNMFNCPEYHSHFKAIEKDRHEVLSEKFAIHFFELKKIGKYHKNQPMEDWLSLINAETEGELIDIMENTVIPEVKKTIVMLREMSADEKVRMEVYYREKRLHDEATALGHAQREGEARGIVKGEAIGYKNGMAQGLEEGRAKGIEEGIAKGLEAGIAKGLEEGITKGLEEGIAKGIEEGRVQERLRSRLEFAESMRKRGISEEIISEMLGEMSD